MRALIPVLCAFALLMSAACQPFVSGGLILNDADQRRAIARYEQALAEHPDDWLLHRRLGLAFFDLKDYARAEQSLERVQALSPGEPESLFYLGLARIGKGEREAGLDLLESFRWPFKFYHQKYVREEARRLRKHPEEPAGQVIKDILAALEAGKREQIMTDRDTLSRWP